MSSVKDIVGQHTEKELIDRITAIIGKSSRDDVIIGIGDDTAVVSGSGDAQLLYTCDMQVQGVHFDLDVISAFQLGRRTLAVNLSDMAAMGAEPQYALVSIAMPPSFALYDFEELFRGLKSLGDEYGTAIIGGNLSSSADNLVIDIFLTGRATRNVFTRSGAKIGDEIYVTGSLGGAHAGWLALEAYGKRAAFTYPGVVKMHQEPIPRIRVSRLLADMDIVTSMIDISDGFSTDLTHICSASNVGALITWSQLPIDALVQDFETMTGADTRMAVLHGGEDYELLFTARPGSEKALANIARKAKVPITAIGWVVSREKGLRLIDGDSVTALEPKGWSHFGSGNR